jgi:uncharacterized hydrophobic protein (TIGR00271 family)
LPKYYSTALFIYTEEGAVFVDPILANSTVSAVTPLHIDTFRQHSADALKDAEHVVISGDLKFIKEMVSYSLEYHFSIGILPLPNQKRIAGLMYLPDDLPGRIETALRKDAQPIDVILCNDQILLFNAAIGRIPLLDNPIDASWSYMLRDCLKKLWQLRLLPFSITTGGETQKVIHTAACGCTIVQHQTKTLASRLIAYDSSITDGTISLVVVAPFSVIDYLRFVFHLLIRSGDDPTLPQSTGYIKNPEITIATEKEMPVEIDGEPVTTTPLRCQVLPLALRVNFGETVSDKKMGSGSKERIDIKALPAGKELVKARNTKVPLFTYASEERFKELFTSLRSDARIHSFFVVLMLLSTILATTGLYLDSASVIIGAMLLAPLMGPIVSLAMGILRQEERLIARSIVTIALGVAIALLTAAVMTMFFRNIPVTGEMQARLSPTVFDLIVAITAGVAGAYTKSYKEILQSLAGVAIAVALVPPLAVAGIGLGRLDLVFFSQAFLLFSTNLVGITFAATFTFRFLGFSPAVKSKRGITIVFVLLCLISVPLYLTYHEILVTREFEQRWEEERFYIEGKYLIIQNAHLKDYGEQDVLTVDIVSRDLLTRADLEELRRKIKYHFAAKLVIRANVIYIP